MKAGDATLTGYALWWRITRVSDGRGAFNGANMPDPIADVEFDLALEPERAVNGYVAAVLVTGLAGGRRGSA